MAMSESEQDEHIKRVTSKIGRAIIDFCRPGREFRADELRNYVSAHCKVAPASADRILRDLRAQKMLNYEILNRRQSLYRVIPVPRDVQMDLF